MSALKKKTVILVTHQVEFLSEVDKILVTTLGFLKLLEFCIPVIHLLQAHPFGVSILFKYLETAFENFMGLGNEGLCLSTMSCCFSTLGFFLLLLLYSFIGLFLPTTC